ncbi:LTA synthase family protein (plasmid) [Pseudalkalibacillus hwajinpoensis]|uniref:LTA synthase family protein n=1 Tax=Guptibacillus hwajinpoensis TaxID=208199 RepID=UPI00325B0FFE
MDNKKGLLIYGIAILLIWLKTYVSYEMNFNLNIENGKQQFLLIFNPLSSIVLLLGITLLFKGKGQKVTILLFSFMSGVVLFSNVLYYRFFSDFITIPVLFQTGNVGDLGGSFTELLAFSDLFLFTDTLILAILMLVMKFEPLVLNKRQIASMFGAALILFTVNLGIAETERPQLLTRTFDREMLVKFIGLQNYHVYDAVLHTKTKTQKVFASESETAEVQNYVNANYKAPNEEMFGKAKGKNVFVITLESTQAFAMEEKVNGKEVTPFLNQLKAQEDTYYFENFYHQTQQGKTSDSEFLLDNSLYPLPGGAVFFTHAQNDYNATPKILQDSGYQTAALHANNKGFWNRDIMYQSLGYELFFDETNYDINESNSYNWGMKDIPFFEQSIDHLNNMKQPFYTKFITLSNHHPFILEEEDKYIDELNTNSTTVNRYLPTVRYTDEALKVFFEDLKKAGLYEDSLFIIYGDHYGISENHNKAMADVIGTEVTPFESTQLQRVPMLIHMPGEGRVDNIDTSTVSGQIDLKPTILHLLGIETKGSIQFGEDLFSPERDELTILRDGRFITDDIVYAQNTFYWKDTGEPIEKDTQKWEKYKEVANEELAYSDQVVYGDLLRFIENSPFDNQAE